MKKQPIERFYSFCQNDLCHGLEIWVLNTIVSYFFFFMTVQFNRIFCFGGALFIILTMLLFIGLDYMIDRKWRNVLVNVGLLFLCYVPMLLIYFAKHGWLGFVTHVVKPH